LQAKLSFNVKDCYDMLLRLPRLFSLKMLRGLLLSLYLDPLMPTFREYCSSLGRETTWYWLLWKLFL